MKQQVSDALYYQRLLLNCLNSRGNVLLTRLDSSYVASCDAVKEAALAIAGPTPFQRAVIPSSEAILRNWLIAPTLMPEFICKRTCWEKVRHYKAIRKEGDRAEWKLEGGEHNLITFKTSVGLVSAVAKEPAKPPATSLTRIFVDPNAISEIYFEGSYKPNRNPPYRTDLVKAGVNPRYNALNPSFFNIWVKICPCRGLNWVKHSVVYNDEKFLKNGARGISLQRPRSLPIQLEVLVDQQVAFEALL